MSCAGTTLASPAVRYACRRRGDQPPPEAMAMAFDRSRVITGHTTNLYVDPDDPTCRRRYLITRFYPTVDRLRKAGAHYRPTEDFSDAGGLFQGVDFASKYDRKTKSWVDSRPPLIGIIRLTWEYLNPEVISHEASHAALHAMRLHQWSKPDTDETIDLADIASEETFCYLVGRIVKQLHTMIDAVDAP